MHLHAGPRVPERVAVGARQPLRALAEPAPRLGNQAHVRRERAQREVQVRVAALAQRAHALRRPPPGGLGARRERARTGRAPTFAPTWLHAQATRPPINSTAGAHSFRPQGRRPPHVSALPWARDARGRRRAGSRGPGRGGDAARPRSGARLHPQVARAREVPLPLLQQAPAVPRGRVAPVRDGGRVKELRAARRPVGLQRARASGGAARGAGGTRVPFALARCCPPALPASPTPARCARSGPLRPRARSSLEAQTRALGLLWWHSAPAALLGSAAPLGSGVAALGSWPSLRSKGAAP